MSSQPPSIDVGDLDRLCEPPRSLSAALAMRARLPGVLVFGVLWLGLGCFDLMVALRYLPGPWRDVRTFIFLGLLPTFGLLFTANGLMQAWRTSRLLRHGIPAAGYIQTCRNSITPATGAKQPELPLIEYRELAWRRHETTPQPPSRFLVGCTGVVVVTLLVVVLGALGAFLAVSLALLGVFFFGALGDLEPEMILTIGGAGAVLCWLRLIWGLRPRRQQADTDALKGLPTDFQNVICTVGFRLADGTSAVVTKHGWRLKGDESDEQPRPLLYDPRQPARTLFIKELGFPLQVDEQGNWTCERPWPFVRVALVLVALAAPISLF
jgi:hypothetical protein